MAPHAKHIAVKYHFVKQLFNPNKREESPFNLVKIATLEQKADIFTKGLGAEAFLRIRKLLCNY